MCSESIAQHGVAASNNRCEVEKIYTKMLHGNVMLCDANRLIWMHLHTIHLVVYSHQTRQVQSDVINHVMV